MEVLFRLSTLFIDVVFPWVVGYFFSQSKYRSDKLCAHLLNLNLFLLWPLLGLFSIWSIKLERSLMLLPVLGIIHYVVPGLIGWYECKNKLESPANQGSYFLTALMPNNITIGFISSFILFGEAGVALTQIMTLAVMPINFLICYPLGQYFGSLANDEKGERPGFKSLFLSKNQLSTLGIFVGLLLNFSGQERPEIFSPLLAGMVHLSAWAFLFSVGHSMNFSAMTKYWKISLGILKYKFLVAPLTIAIGAYLFFDNPTIIGTAIVIGFSPVAIFSIVISQTYKLNHHLAIAAVLVSHIAFAAVVFPILIFTKDWLW